jgi:hypothetical protein
MKIKQAIFSDKQWKLVNETEGFAAEDCQLVLAFGAKRLLQQPERLLEIRNAYPSAHLVVGSTAGEIVGNSVYDETIVTTAILFEKSTVNCAVAHIDEFANSYEAGKALIRKLESDGLVSVLVIADGTKINGSELVMGLNLNKPPHARIVGGLAGDGGEFVSTIVGLDGAVGEGYLVAVGFYGSSLKAGSGSLGGWDEFGPERTITKSDKNVLYEIDGKNALSLYKTYLGPYEKELPGSAFLFPLAITVEGAKEKLVRTIISIDEKNQSMTFAGNMPVGSKLRLMKANFDRLIEASSEAARDSFTTLKNSTPELAILISCVGRKIILKERVYEEIEAAKNVFGSATYLTGFYSYGELSPLNNTAMCELHNQTMTITTLTEN